MANRELTPWGGSQGVSPFGRDPFFTLRREMDRLFDDLLSPAEPRSFAASRSASAWPSVDIHETEQAYVVTAEVPGLEEKDIDLSLRDNVLTLRGEKKREHKEEDKGRLFTERFYGRFERSIPFAAEVDPDRVEATFKAGVLTVTLPKNQMAQDQARRIEIKPQG